MLRIQNRHVDWEKHQIAIPGKHAKDRENRRIPFDPEGRLAPILKRRKSLGPSAFVFGSPAGADAAPDARLPHPAGLRRLGHEARPPRRRRQAHCAGRTRGDQKAHRTRQAPKQGR